MVSSQHPYVCGVTNQYVFWAPPGACIEDKTVDGGWYFWDETGLVGGGPYLTEKEACKALHNYASYL